MEKCASKHEQKNHLQITFGKTTKKKTCMIQMRPKKNKNCWPNKRT
jgi:hypothetical protein